MSAEAARAAVDAGPAAHAPRRRADRLDAEGIAYLARVGARLRHVRALRGMTQRLLAARSGVSERQIALLEGGAGNISILLLRRLARALGTDVAALVAEQRDRPLELGMLEQTLAHLPPAELARARAVLLERFAAPASRPSAGGLPNIAACVLSNSIARWNAKGAWSCASCSSGTDSGVFANWSPGPCKV